MRLYLVRHADAHPGGEDSEKFLTDEGRKTLEKVGSGIGKLRLSVPRIVHSQKLRAKQTAEGLAKVLNPQRGMEAVEGLNPLDPPDRARMEADRSPSDLMMVGHLPHLSRLASLLLTGDPEGEFVRFESCTVACLEKRSESDSWTLVFVLQPELF